MAEKLTIVIDGKSLTAQKAFDKVIKKMDKTEKKTKSLGASLKKMKGGFLAVTAAMAGVVAIGLKAVKAFAEQEKAELLLNKAFSKTSDNADELTESFKRFAAEQQLLTKFGDEVTIMAAAQLQALAGLTGEGLEKALKATMDLSVAQGIDLNTAALLVGKSVSSSTNALARYGIEMKKGGTATERLNDLTGTLSEKFGGFAEKEGASAAGIFARLSNDIGDVFEVIGSFLTPALITLSVLFGKLVAPAFDLESATKDLVKINKQYKQVLIDLKDPTNKLTEAQKGLLEVQESQLKVKFTERLNEINDLFTKSTKTGSIFKGTQQKLKEEIVFLTSKSELYLNALKAIKEGTFDTSNSLRKNGFEYRGLANIQDNARNFATKLEKAQAKLNKETSKTTIGVNEFTGAFLDGILTQEKFLTLTKEFQQAIKDNIPIFEADAAAAIERDEKAATSNKARKRSEIASAKTLEEEEKRIADEKLARESAIADEVKLIQDIFNEATKLSEIELLEFKKEKLEENFENFKLSTEQMNNIDIARADLKKKLLSIELKQAVGNMSSILSSAANLGNSINTLGGVQLENEKKKLAAIGDTNSAEFKAQEKRVKQAAKKQAKVDKKFAIFQATLNLFQAIASAFATVPGGPITKSIASGVAAVIAGVNLATVVSTPLPSFAAGGNFTVPEGFPSDSFPISVESGEDVSITSTAESEGRGLDSGGGGSTIIIENMTVQTDDPDNFAEQMEDFAISTGGRVKTR